MLKVRAVIQVGRANHFFGDTNITVAFEMIKTPNSTNDGMRMASFMPSYANPRGICRKTRNLAPKWVMIRGTLRVSAPGH